MATALPFRSKRVLLVDGDVRSSRRLAQLLAQDGYEVDVAYDEVSALARLELPVLPDVLVTELRLPLGDGASVARQARARSPRLRVVVLTRYLNAVVPSKFGSPPPCVLPKPLDYERLLAALSESPVPTEEALAASPSI